MFVVVVRTLEALEREIMECGSTSVKSTYHQMVSVWKNDEGRRYQLAQLERLLLSACGVKIAPELYNDIFYGRVTPDLSRAYRIFRGEESG